MSSPARLPATRLVRGTMHMFSRIRGPVFHAALLAAISTLSGCLLSEEVSDAEQNLTPPTTNEPPSISGNPPQMVRVGVSYSFVPEASDPDGDPMSFAIQNRPNWTTFDPTDGSLTGVPFLGNEGTYADIVISVSDGVNSSALQPFIITVEPANGNNMPPIISGTPPASVTVGATYAFQPSASDPDGDPLGFTAQNRPPWATFDTATGRLAGTPQAGDAGTYSNISISVSDGSTTASLPAFSITVNENNSPPVISGSPPAQTTADQTWTFTPTASDPDGDVLTFTAQNAPSWATLNASTGTMSGTPGTGDVGTYSNIVITVSDGTASASLPAFSVEVIQAATGFAELSWTAPTTNTDGTALTDLVAYRIYYGTSAGSYSASAYIDNPGLTTYTVENLSPATWYFVATAVNSSGVESQFSNEASKTVD